MNIKSSKFYRLVFLIVGLITVAVVVYNIGVVNIYDNIRKTGWWFVAIIGIWGVIYLINTLSWYLIVCDSKESRKKVPFRKLYKITISGYVINYVTPVVAIGGEPYRIMELKKYVGGHKATSSVILYSMMHIVSHFLFWLFSSVLVYFVSDTTPAVIAVLMGVGVFCLIALYYFFKGYRYGLVAKTFRFLGKLPWAGKHIRKFNDRHQEDFQKVDAQISELHSCRRGAFYGSLFVEFISRIVGCLEIYFIVLAVGQNITFFDSIILGAVSSLFANIMFFAPMQLGTREGGFWLATKGISMSAGLGLYISLITRIRETFWIIIGLLLMERGKRG